MEDKSNLYVVAIVGVIAIIGIFTMILTIGNGQGIVFSTDDVTGQVHARSISGHVCRQHLGGHMVNGVCRGDPRQYPTDGGTPIDPNYINQNNIQVDTLDSVAPDGFLG